MIMYEFHTRGMPHTLEAVWNFCKRIHLHLSVIQTLHLKKSDFIKSYNVKKKTDKNLLGA